MNSNELARTAKTFLDNFACAKAAHKNRTVLIEHLSNRSDLGNSLNHISQMHQKERESFNDLLDEVTTAIEILPDTRGKTALFLHYLNDEPYKCLAVDLNVSERQLMRDIHTALEQLGDVLLEERSLL